MQRRFSIANSTSVQPVALSHVSSMMVNNTTFPLNDNDTTFFPSGLGLFGSLYHLVMHPKIKDWLQLFLLGLTAELARRFSKYLISWAKHIFCITSTHSPTDDSYSWLMGKSWASLLDRARDLTSVDPLTPAYWIQDPRWQKRCRSLYVV